MTAKRRRDCACHSGRAYAACCKPRHDGVTPAETPEALMRSRYAAFALGLGGYLVETLAAAHPDRAHPDDLLARELSRAKDGKRFLGLTVHGSRDEGETGEVHFTARVFEKGQDRSFTERSTFVREGGAWRYLSGVMGEGGGADGAP